MRLHDTHSADGPRCAAALLVMIVLLVLTPVFKYMPQNAQGAIVISAVFGLFNYTEWWFLWKVSCFPFVAGKLVCSINTRLWD